MSYNIEWNSVKCTFLLTLTRILQNSSKISEKLRSWLFWSSTEFCALLNRGNSLPRNGWADDPITKLPPADLAG